MKKTHNWLPEEDEVLLTYMHDIVKNGGTKTAAWRSAAKALNMKPSQTMAHYYDLTREERNQNGAPVRKPFKNITDKPVKSKPTLMDSNPSDVQRGIIIQNANRRIEELEKSKDGIRATYEEKKTQLDMAQSEFAEIGKQWDELINEQEENKSIIKMFIATAPKEKPQPASKSKPIAFGFGLPVQDNAFGRKVKHVKKHINWLKEAVDVLQEKNEFMQPIDLWNAIIAKPHIKEAFKSMSSATNNLAGVRIAQMKNWLTHAAMYVNDSAKSNVYKPHLTLYNNLLGYYQWVDQDGIPKDPKHMLPFLHGKVEMKLS